MRSRLGERLSPERDSTSLKLRPFAWARAQAQARVCPLQVSPRWDRVAWARITGLTTVHPATATHSHPTNKPSIPQFNHNTLGINHGTVTRKTQQIEVNT